MKKLGFVNHKKSKSGGMGNNNLNHASASNLNEPKIANEIIIDREQALKEIPE